MRISDWSSDVCSSDLLGLKRGTIEGRVEVDQGNGGPVPTVTVALDLKGSTLSAIAGGGGAVDGRLNGKVRLVGKGGTFREAVGQSDGSMGLVATQGVLPARIADRKSTRLNSSH